MVLLLISKGAGINKPNSDQDQVISLYGALRFDKHPINVKIAELLLASGADANKPMFDGHSPMLMAHYGGHKEAISLLHQYGADINSQNNQGKTPLHCLLEFNYVSSGNKLMVINEFLTIYDMKIKDQGGKTAIDYAIKYYPKLLPILATNVEPINSINLCTVNSTS